jgi:hypothetical protein
MQRIEVRRRLPKHVLINALGLGKLALLVQGHPLLKLGLDLGVGQPVLRLQWWLEFS